MPRTTPDIEVSCKGCGERFFTKQSMLDSGRGRYHNRECYLKYGPASSAHSRAEQIRKPAETKECAACGKEFLVGGRGNPPRRVRFCSVACQRAARYRHGARARELTAVEAAYIAGIWDGEGSVMLYMRRDAVALKITVANTFLPLIEWLKEKTEIGAGLTKDRTPDKHKVSHWFQANSEAAESLLRQIQPYLIVKAQQTALALDFMERIRVPALKADRTWQLEYRAKMKALNRRGPTEE